MNARFAPPLFSIALSALLLLALPGCSKPASAPQTTPTSPAAAMPEVNDIDLSTQVKTTLLNDPHLKDLNLTVTTLKGDVRLSGVVTTTSQRDQVLLLARGVPGVHSLHDELTLKP